MTSASNIALSGLNAAALRAQAAASNIANAQTSGAINPNDGAPAYQPVDVVQTSVLGTAGGGTKAQLEPRIPATQTAYAPDQQGASSDGYVAVPNVNVTEEIISLKSAARAYEANASVARVASEMERALIDRFSETV